MTTALDITDVPPVACENLALPMQHMIDAGRGLVMLRGMSDEELREVECAVWNEIDASAQERVAVLLRFRCLIAVFASARLRRLLLSHGFRTIAPALRVAARMRLSVRWGFNAFNFARALEAELAALDNSRRISRRREQAQAEVAVAAMA